MSCNLQLHVISSSGECYIKIYFNVAYVYFGPQTLRSSFVQACINTYHKDISCQLPLQEEFEDAKGEIRIRKSKDRQHNGQIKIENRTHNKLHKTKGWVTDHHLKQRLNSGAPEGWAVPFTLEKEKEMKFFINIVSYAKKKFTARLQGRSWSWPLRYTGLFRY